MEATIDDSHTSALLLMDLQRGVFERLEDPEPFARRVAEIREAADVRCLRSIYIRVAFRPGHPEISASNHRFAEVARSGLFVEGTQAVDIHPTVAPRAGDIVITKRRVSAFHGSELDSVLRSLGVTTVILAGLVTSGVVLSTLRDASDRDYSIVVLEDGCADGDPELHNLLMTAVFPRQARVVHSSDFFRA